MTSDARALWLANDWDALAPLLERAARSALVRERPDPDDLDDIAQATLVKCWQLTEVPNTPLAFAATVARNLWRDANKGARGRRTRRSSDEPLALLADPGDLPDAAVQRDATRQHVRAALAVLPPHYQRALVLFHVGTPAIPPVAHALGIGISACKMRLCRARVALAAAYHARAA